MIRSVLIIAFLIMCVLSPASWAQTTDWHASVLAGGLLPDSSRNGFKSAAGGTATVSRTINSDLSAELRAFVYNIGTKNVSNDNMQGLSLGLTWHGTRRGLEPYLMAAPAVFRSVGPAGRATDPGLDFAVGMEPVRFSKGVRLRVEFVSLVDFYMPSGHHSVFTDFGLNIGLQFGFPLSQTSAVPASRGSHNPRYTDDNDHDGVPNQLDRCPFTPKGVKVNAQGCSMDKDMDGVPDYRDSCPNTPKGVPVGSNGCALKPHNPTAKPKREPAQSSTSTSPPQRVDAAHFAPNSTALDAHSETILKSLADTLKQTGYQHIVVIGHTAALGKSGGAHRVALARAKRVRDYLIKQGLQASKLSTKAAAPTHLPSQMTTQAAKQARHVELLIYY